MLFICTELGYSLYIQNINVLTKSTGASSISQILWLQNWAVSRRKDLSVVGIVILRTSTIGKTAYQSSRGNSSAGIWAGVWQKLNTVHLVVTGVVRWKTPNALLFAGPTQRDLDTFDVHITRIKSLSSLHHCSMAYPPTKLRFFGDIVGKSELKLQSS